MKCTENYVCSCILLVITLALWLPAWFAIYVPGQQRLQTWSKPADGCLCTNRGRTYECSCSTDEYGVTTCSTCTDYDFTYETTSGNSVTFSSTAGPTSYSEGERYKCIYDPNNLQDVEINPEGGVNGVFIALQCIGGALLLFAVLIALYCKKWCDDYCNKRPRRSPPAGGFKGIVLFGPPGVGKRTIMEVAKQRGYSTHDIIPLGRDRLSRKAAAMPLFVACQQAAPGTPPTIFCAADLLRDNIPSYLETVVIKPSKAEYLRRYQMCCERRPEERAHNEHQIYNGFVTHIFDRLISSNLSADSALDTIVGGYATPSAALVQPAAVSVAVPVDGSESMGVALLAAGK